MSYLQLLHAKIAKIRLIGSVTRKVKISELSVCDDFRSSRTHFPQVEKWIQEAADADSIVLCGATDPAGSILIYDGRARLTTLRSIHGVNHEVSVSIFSGSLTEAIIVHSLGANSAVLNVQERVVNLIIRLCEVLQIEKRNNNLISTTLNEILSSKEFTLRHCRLSTIDCKSDRDLLAGSFGDDTNLVTAGESKLKNTLLKHDFSELAIQNICSDLIDVYEPEKYLNSGDSSVRLRFGKDHPPAHDLVQSVQRAFAKDVDSTLNRMLVEDCNNTRGLWILDGRVMNESGSKEFIMEIAKKCNARKFFFVVCDEDDAFFKIDQAITVRMATCDRGITKDGLTRNSVKFIPLFTENGKLANSNDVKEWARLSGVSMIMTPTQIATVIGDDFILGCTDFDHRASRAAFIELIPFTRKVVECKGSEEDLVGVVKECYGKIRSDIRNPPKPKRDTSQPPSKKRK